jgi:hypothetical protein
MARTGISFEDVRDAAESLLGRGLNPTIQRVRELLGTGSNTTISEHLKSWQQQLAKTPKIVLPSDRSGSGHGRLGCVLENRRAKR